MTTLTPTEEQIKELVALEEMLSVLDQHAGNASDIQRACLKAYGEFDKLRKRDLEEWNATEPEQIYRCAKAESPYQTEADGECGVYAVGGTLCEYHAERAAEADVIAQRERAEYFAAKRRGEDV